MDKQTCTTCANWTGKLHNQYEQETNALGIGRLAKGLCLIKIGHMRKANTCSWAEFLATPPSMRCPMWVAGPGEDAEARLDER